MKPEFRNWFTILNSSTPSQPNQETPAFPKTKNVSGVTKTTIFLTNAEPSEEVYKKLFLSLIFKLNPEDRAKDSNDSEQKSSSGQIYGGHVTVATNEEAKNNNNGNTNLETRVPRVSHLPTVEQGITEINTLINNNTTLINDLNLSSPPTENISVFIDNTVTTRNNFKVILNNSIISWVYSIAQSLKTYIDNRVNTINNNINNIQSRSFTTTVSNLTNNVVNITHNLNSKEIICAAYVDDTQIKGVFGIIDENNISFIKESNTFENVKFVILK